MDKVTVKTVEIEGEFGSLAAAVEACGLSRPTITDRIKKGIIAGYYIENLGWLVNIESAKSNADWRKPGPKGPREITA